MQKSIELLRQSKRPAILLGSGSRNAENLEQLIDFAQSYSIPIMTAWSHDLLETNHPTFVGRPGTIGTRPGNFVVQSCDYLLVIGSRLNIRQISYNWDNFAPNAEIIQVDIDKNELSKPFPKTSLGIEADAQNFIIEFIEQSKNLKINFAGWLAKCKKIQKEYEPSDSDYSAGKATINPYHLIPECFNLADEAAIFVSANATACIVPFQRASIKKGQRLFSNSGSASMGYDLPAAIGAAQAAPNRSVICFAGDGSVMMNLQELQTIINEYLNICIVLLDNGGYLSIKQTQTNFFKQEYGASPASGVSFPNFKNVLEAFGFQGVELHSGSWKAELNKAIKGSGPRFVIAHLNRDQEFEPRLKSRMVDGVIQTPELDDMFPFLEPKQLQEIRSYLLGS